MQHIQAMVNINTYLTVAQIKHTAETRLTYMSCIIFYIQKNILRHEDEMIKCIFHSYESSSIDLEHFMGKL